MSQVINHTTNNGGSGATASARQHKIIIAGGGTGGHIFPAIAIANAIKQQLPGVEILFVGAKGKMEMERVPQAGYNIEGLDIAGFNRSSLIKNIGLPVKLMKSFFQVRKIINAFQPDAVIGVGGYSSFPVLRYAQQKSIPTFIHESNSFAGKSNMLLGKKATRIFVASEGMEKFFPAGKITITGNPVRKSIVQSKVTRAEALDFFGLDESKKTILVVGGSLGARSINEVMISHLSDLKALDLQLVWQTGKVNAEAYKQTGGTMRNVWVNDFIVDMDKAYAAADVVVSRAGAMAVTELCVVKKPVVFVPFPFAAEDHQTVNAKYLVEKNAAVMVADSEVRTKLFSALTTLAMDEEKQQVLKENISKLAVTDADEVIAQTVIKAIGG
ncbi:UDP-N-acetylglucosamine-N-acetylmuramylpentapeptide N-acetylglucosamine transferase [Filimonas lacunae]|uniref:UDP-N-acetylglucosamine--N-acetylmuramyl-(pentapeptide) pyrophosphoryl-undecaprenol N-acetylglucosamine transferase n=1 Tax=Filimonas lacunae TaxID=477680 RepID=A0A173MRS8_9BACT|nr:undecaprenyldiphospho-muramoylpentapeptide beta-N-acetylglucosaminyltransferase [Filimonas lacunae]BAV10354.1 UDP-N-acetylglucosamine-N-acetylmuramyl-(pentapeptide) pyrophosphoryl-undecaprenol N-acetylglucosamine transferase [Filimonas lacunae]SIT16755.1 UDP-N-acetylglucosamine-N-acetylmuramylpentapeptide N-acetylglucosamine transferase [Filimonas lacunae]